MKTGAVAALCVLVGFGCRRGEQASAPPEAARAQARPAAPATYDGSGQSASESSRPSGTEPKVKAEPPKGPRPPQTIFRSEIERALAGGPAYLLRQLAPEPYRVSGKFIGWEITRLFPDDPELCDPCDLAIGDVILSINGDRLETPQAFAAMVEKAGRLKTLEVRSLRDEQRRVVKYAIVDD